MPWSDGDCRDCGKYSGDCSCVRFQEDETSGEQQRFAAMLVPRQSCNLVRRQNSIWRGGFQRREYREAMRIQFADFQKSRAS